MQQLNRSTEFAEAINNDIPVVALESTEAVLAESEPGTGA